ncbi:MAG: MlaE family lipid ABC transporter permease subunit [Calditrichaeota bacterium]|nr:MlaE family lipid ABC transporter permease subunit [Calditrichota bacterium]
MKTRSDAAPSTPAAFAFQLEGDVLYLKGSLVLAGVDQQLPKLKKQLRKYPRKFLRINLRELQRIDSIGVAALQHLRDWLQAQGIKTEIEAVPPGIQQIMQTFAIPPQTAAPAGEKDSALERFGERVYDFWVRDVYEFLLLLVDVIYYSVVDLFQRKAHRKGEFFNQATLIGVNAVPIIGLIAFLIGVVLALQSGEQLRQFGANIFVADLTVVAMVQEMGPLITAIMVAGRSGSSIASEIATMVVTEEVDALKTMGLNPIRFIVVPKMHALVFTLPFLTILADALGITGGLLVAYLNLDLAPQVFYNRMVEVLYVRDVAIGFVKSLVFAVLIVLNGSFFGFRVKGGAEGVGKVTTTAVVGAIILVIVADSILGLIFY